MKSMTGTTKFTRRIRMILIGMALLSALKIAAAAGCEGDHPVFPQAASLPVLRQRAAAGDAAAQEKLALAYWNGIGVKQDTSQALVWLRKSAAGGNVEGQYLVGKYDLLHAKPGSDMTEAAHWLRLAAGRHCVPAQFYFGVLTLNDVGAPKDVKAGQQMIVSAAKAGYPEAQVWLGSMLITGQDMPKDPKAGFAWIERAGKSGDSVGELALASAYLGGHGPAADRKKARHILESVYAKHEKNYSPAAAYSLGWMYMEGKGVPVNKPMALSWMLIAANARVGDAVSRVKTLVGELPKKPLARTCPVYMDPAFATDGSRAYTQMPGGERFIVLETYKTDSLVYFPDHPLAGFVTQSCVH